MHKKKDDARKRRTRRRANIGRRDKVDGKALGNIALTVMHTGFRESEVLRLKWTDFDEAAAAMSTRVVADTTSDDFMAIHHYEEELQGVVARGGSDQQPIDPVAARAEQRQAFRIATLVAPVVRWACDWPYHESGVNAHGGRDYALFVWRGEDRVEVARGNSWDGLYAAVGRAAAERPFWGRPLGVRQQVYDHAYAWRLSVGVEPLDAHDMALGAADSPFIGMNYFIGWMRANPQEVAAHPFATVFIREADKEGYDLSGLLREALAHPAGRPPRTGNRGEVENETPAPGAPGYRVRTGDEVRAMFGAREEAVYDAMGANLQAEGIRSFDGRREQLIAQGRIVLHPDGAETHKMSPEMSTLFDLQRDKFRFKFGREHRRHDTVFFDVDADTPQPDPMWGEAATEETIAVVRATATEIGLDPDKAVETIMGREELADYKRRRQS